MMKKALIFSLVLAMLATSFVFADTEQSTLSKITGLTDQEISALTVTRGGYGRIIAASIVSKLTGASIQDVLAANTQGKSFAEIAQADGIELEQYQDTLLDTKLAYVDEQVKSGTLTEEQGKIIKERIQQNIENCDGQGFNGTQDRFGSEMGMNRGARRGGMRFSSNSL